MFSWFDAVNIDFDLGNVAFLERFPNSDLAWTAEQLAERARQHLIMARTSPSILGITDAPKVETVIKEVVKKVRVPGPERIVRVPGPVKIKTVVKTVVKEVPGPVRIKTVLKKVPGPVRIKTVIKKVPGPVRIKTVIKRVPGPVRIKTIVKRVPGPVRIKTIIKRVRGPVRTVVRQVRVPCRCRRPRIQ